MAQTEVNVEWQTNEILKCLFEDYDDVSCRQYNASNYETDGPTSEDDNFDPVLVADKLRSIGDTLNDDARFKAALSGLKQAAAEEAIDAAFSQGVEALCQTPAAQQADVAPEMQLIRASVAFGLYVKKSSPELKSKVQQAMNSFLNRKVGPWVKQLGGWDKVPGV